MSTTCSDSKADFLTKSNLKERGWTEKTIERWLGEADRTKTNPYRKSGPPMQLYRLDRVVETEANPEFVASQAGLDKRRESAAKAVATKEKQTMDYVRGLVPSVGIIHDKNTLIEAACEHYNDLHASRGHDDKYAHPRSDQDFLQRITVNFLRHQMSGYEDHLDQVFGKTGAGNARLVIRDKVLRAIADSYPWLASECFRQM